MGKLRKWIYHRVGKVELAPVDNIITRLRPAQRAEAIRMLVARRGVDEAAQRLGISAEQIPALTLRSRVTVLDIRQARGNPTW